MSQPEVEYFEVTKPEMIYLSGWMDDLNELLAHLSASAKPLDRAAVASMFASATRMFAACAREETAGGSRIIGVVLLCNTHIMAGKKSWIEDVVVHPDFRGRGISTTLMNMAESAAWVWGAKHINLTSQPHRGPARVGYEKRGYVLRDTGVYRLMPVPTN